MCIRDSLCLVLAGCGNVAAAKEEARQAISEAKLEATEPAGPTATDAAGRAYLAKLAATVDTACKCTTQECGESVIKSWGLQGMTAGWGDHTLSDVDRGREDA